MMGDKISREAGDARAPTCRRCPGTDGATTLAEARARQPTRSATRCCSRRAPAAAARACASSTRPTSSRTRSRTASAEAQAAFGDATLYVEKALVPARHVEIQVLCDAHGNVLTLGERECSIQRRHQKLIEESPSPALTPELREAMEAAAERACRAVGYRNAGHVRVPARPRRQLLLHRAERAPAGRASGDRAVHRHRPRARAAARSRPASALGSTGRAPRRGHAIEIRLNAEDPERDFLPSPGPDRALPARRRARACASTRSSRAARRSRRTTTR